MTDALHRFLRLATATALSLCVGVLPAFSQAALLPNAKQTFLDQDGNPLSGGKVYSYVPNTTTFKTTWSNSTQTTPNVNPVVLDAAGRAVIYGQGNYSQKVTDSADNQQWNALTTAYGSSSPSGATGTDTAPVGTVMPFAGLVVPTNWQFAYGQAVSRSTFSSLMTAITIVDATASCVSTSTTISNLASTAQMRVGAPLEASCVSTGTTIVSVASATSVVVNNAATSTGTVVTTVFPWGNGDGVLTFNVPDMRGRVLAGPDAMGGTAASRLQVLANLTTTATSVTATVSSAAGLSLGMFILNPNVTPGTTISAISGTTVTLSTVAPASGTLVASRFSVISDAGAPGGAGGGAGSVLAQTNLPNVSFSVSGTINSYNTSVQVANPGSSNVPNIDSGRTSCALPICGTLNAASGGAATPLTVVQPTITLNYIVKMAPNTTGAGGVVSIGGMFGDILCGSNVTCTAQTISFSGTPILTQNQIYVGNASNQAVSVAMTGDCSVVASGAITCTKTSGVTFTTAATTSIGTSGATIPLLSAANTWALGQTMPTLSGNTVPTGSGTVAVSASAPLALNAGTGALTINGAALSKGDDTNVTLTLTGAPTTALVNASTITVGWTGTLAFPRGGFGFGSAAQGDIFYADTTTSVAKLNKDTNTTRYLSNTGTTNNPAWAQVALTTGVSDYAEGSWTPVLAGSVTPGTQTYSSQVGRYIRIGNMVTIWANIVLTAKGGTTSGNMQITGLPFAVSNITNYNPSAQIGYQGSWDLNVAGGYYSVGAFAGPNTSILGLVEMGDNVGPVPLTEVDFGNTSVLILTMTYRIN